jgi:hypothetical protein
VCYLTIHPPNQPAAGATAADAQQPKRRGRPPKDQQSPQPSEPKRGRGRPPKQPSHEQQQQQQQTPPARPPPPSYDSLPGAQGSSGSSKPAPAPPALTPGNSAASLTEEDSFYTTNSVSGGGGGGVRWALALVAVALFPRAVAGTLRKLTGGNGALGVDGAGAVRRNRFLAGACVIGVSLGIEGRQASRPAIACW